MMLTPPKQFKQPTWDASGMGSGRARPIQEREGRLTKSLIASRGHIALLQRLKGFESGYRDQH